MNNLRTITAAKDSITQFLARRYPLKNIAQDVIAERKLNSTERRVLFDLVFRWSREICLFEQFLKQHLPFSSSMSAQEKNGLALSVFAHDMGLLPNDNRISSCAHDYAAYVKTLGNLRGLYSLQPFIRTRLLKDYSENAEAIALGLCARPAKYLAYDRRILTTDAVIDALSRNGITTFVHERLKTAIGSYDDIALATLPPLIRDNVWFMDAGSQIIAELISPRAHERVLDMCVGEGNKARYITMHDCHYVAVDNDPSRLKKAKARLDHKQCEFMVADARSLPLLAKSFDWILLDAPCTGTGVLRRHPDLMHRLSEKELNQSLQLQEELLKSAITLLKPNGILIYATCSLLRVENDLQIANILTKNNQIKPYALSDLVSARIKLNRDALGKNSMSLFPHSDNCDGFFFAALQRCSLR